MPRIARYPRSELLSAHFYSHFQLSSHLSTLFLQLFPWVGCQHKPMKAAMLANASIFVYSGRRRNQRLHRSPQILILPLFLSERMVFLSYVNMNLWLPHSSYFSPFQQEHVQVTVRTRTPGTPILATSQYCRYITITCLLCHLLVYRVYQTYPADVDGKDGPLLPTDDWVERDIMKSLSGWIEVHNQCLVSLLVSLWGALFAQPDDIFGPNGELIYTFPTGGKSHRGNNVIPKLFKFIFRFTPSSIFLFNICRADL